MSELSPVVHKAGFVNIVGKPNAGKSTLMNALMGERLSIITPKAQTTRHRIMGIMSDEHFQIVFSDTPGIIEPHYELHKIMMNYVHTSLEDADVLLYVSDATSNENEEKLYQKLNSSDVPLFLVINKIDLIKPDQLDQLADVWQQRLPKARIISVSAAKRFNTDVLLQLVLEHLPEHPPYFDKDELSDKNERFFAAEMIREKIFENYEQEIPYSCEVRINSFKEEEDIIRISAEILVERSSQKGIIIGKGGQMLKKVGMGARKSMEDFFQKKVFLEQHVRVEENWRQMRNKLERFGYLS
jgi:GTP-binding protein Era